MLAVAALVTAGLLCGHVLVGLALTHGRRYLVRNDAPMLNVNLVAALIIALLLAGLVVAHLFIGPGPGLHAP